MVEGGGGGTQEWGFMDTGPKSRLLTNTREEGEGASHCPAHSPAGAHLCLQAPTPVPFEAHRALCGLASAYVPSCPATANFPYHVIACL